MLNIAITTIIISNSGRKSGYNSTQKRGKWMIDNSQNTFNGPPKVRAKSNSGHSTAAGGV